MKTCTIITVTASGNVWLSAAVDLREVGYALKLLVERHGGRCLAQFNGETLLVAVQNISRELLSQALTVWGRAVGKNGHQVQFTQRDHVPISAEEWPEPFVKPGALIAENLTKRLMHALPDGCWVVSNCLSCDTGHPLFAEQLTDIRTRSIAWERAKASGASGRLCHVAWTKAEFQDRLNKCRPPPPEQGGR